MRTGDPVPAALSEHPSAVVKYDPPERFFAHPRPSGIGVGPVAHRVRSPRRIHAGLPTGTRIRHVHPASIGREYLRELVEIHWSLLGGKFLGGEWVKGKEGENPSREGEVHRSEVGEDTHTGHGQA
jgi:hypothetical protein